MTIREVAELAGWSYDRMKAHLLRLNRELGGMLLTVSAPPNRRYTLLLPALRRACPDMFESLDNLEMRVGEVEEATKSHEKRLGLMASHVGDITRDVAALKYRRVLSMRVEVNSAP